jgi:hypothetical protein
MIFRHCRAIALSLMLAAASPVVSAVDYQDIWWDPNQSGMGYFVGQQDDQLGIGWFHYGSDGKAAYLLLSGKLSNGVVDGQLERSSGPAPGSGYNAAQVVREKVGTATLRFNDANSATLSYSYDNRSGTMNLSRMTFNSPWLSGSWQVQVEDVSSACSNPSDNGLYQATATQTFGAVSGTQQPITIDSGGGNVCTFTVTPTRVGSLITGTGNFSCASGGRGIFTETTRIVDGQYLITEFRAQETGTSQCLMIGRRIGYRK